MEVTEGKDDGEEAVKECVEAQKARSSQGYKRSGEGFLRGRVLHVDLNKRFGCRQ